MLKVDRLGKTFDRGRVSAVKNLSFHCSSGEIYGLLGPNGAGKTTTLRCLSTLIRPTFGNAWFDGVSVLDDPRRFRSRIGFLTSDMKLDGYFTPDYMLEWFGRLNKMESTAIEERKRKLLSDLQMEDFSRERIDNLSTGMKQKTAIAISLMHDPDLIIFDEPTNGLDVLTCRSVTRFLEDCAIAGKTVLISTHIMSVAEKLCHRFGILARGELKTEGTLEQILAESGGNSLEEVFFSHIDPMGGSDG